MIKLKSLLEGVDRIKCPQCGWSWLESEGGGNPYLCHKCGYESNSKEFNDFAGKRLEGATKIADNAREKGGPAMLTYHHFAVKLPYYERASKGDFNCDMAKLEYKTYLDTLCGITSADGMDQVEFQKLVGLIEVLGELIIKHKQNR